MVSVPPSAGSPQGCVGSRLPPLRGALAPLRPGRLRVGVFEKKISRRGYP
ncbi:MAG: hypothetical protein E7K72_06560 [Roseomonas mucosa]|nr:hypothetical protein [Roseomonas mucosa]